MSTIASADHRRRLRTEVYSPIEVVLARIIYWIFGVIIALLALRFVFGLFGANTGAPFVQVVYAITDVFMIPFAAVFRTGRLEGATFEWSVLLAMVIYALIAWAIVSLIHAVSPRDHAQTVDEVETIDRDEDVVHRR